MIYICKLNLLVTEIKLEDVHLPFAAEKRWKFQSRKNGNRQRKT